MVRQLPYAIAGTGVEAGELGGDVVGRRGDGAAEFAQAVVVGDEGPVGVPVLLGQLVRALEQRGRGGDGGAAGGVSLSHDAEVAATGAGGVGFGEVGVTGVESGRREELDAATVQGADLLAGAADGGRGGDHLGAGAVGRGAQPEDGRLVQADGGAERAGEQMQLVLDDEGRRQVPYRCPARGPEQPSGARFPGQPGELVDGAEDEGGRPVVELLVDDGDGQFVVEDASLARAEEGEGVGAGAHSVVADVGRLVCGQNACAAPGAAVEDEHVLRPGGLAGVVEGGAGLLVGVGCGGLAHPQTDGEGLLAVRGRIGTAQGLQGADGGGGALELLGGEQAEGVAAEYGGPAAVGSAAAQHHGERGQQQVGLGLAATGGEPDQVGDGPVRVPGVGHPVQGEQEERELEGAPVGVGRGLRACRYGVPAGSPGAREVGRGVPHLQGHRAVGGAEGVQQLGTARIAQGADAGLDAGDGGVDPAEHPVGGVAPPLGDVRVELPHVPGAVVGGELGQLLAQLVDGNVRVGEVAQVEHR